MSEFETFMQARQVMLDHKNDWAAASTKFQWPELKYFNWATDYFDTIAKGNSAPALRILEEDGTAAGLTYAELSARSSQVANFLKDLGARPGDRMMLMLGNEVPLWETMMAAIKMGVVVIPATTLLSGVDLQDRIVRGNIKWLMTNASGMAKVQEISASDLPPLTCILADSKVE